MKKCKCKDHSKLAKLLNELVASYHHCEGSIKEMKTGGPTSYGDVFYPKLKVLRIELNHFKDIIRQTKLDIKNAQRQYNSKLEEETAKNEVPVTPDDILKSLYFNRYTLNKPQFVAVMNIIKGMMDRDFEFGNDVIKAINKHNGGSSEGQPYDLFDNLGLIEYNDMAVRQLIQWLVSVMGDHEGGSVSESWIAYFIYERDWGRNPIVDATACVMDTDGNPIPFDTIEDVYDLIINNKNSK